jgi:hypothetical protein
VVIVSGVLCPLPVQTQNWLPGTTDARTDIFTYAGQETAFRGFAVIAEGPIIKYEWDFY